MKSDQEKGEGSKRKQKETAVILSQEELADGIYSMWLRADAAIGAKPGQFVNLFTNDNVKLLPRPLSICEAEGEGENPHRLRVVYRVTGKHTGTAEFSKLRNGDSIEIMGPLGNGFPPEAARHKKALLIGGGIGIPPLLSLAKQLPSRTTSIVLGYKDGDLFLTDDFADCGDVFLATEDGSEGTTGTVLDAIRANDIKADVVYACGPAAMLKAVKTCFEEQNIPCYLSLEERMACGIGACLSCVCKSTDVDPHSNTHTKRVCKDGPVFLSTEVEL